MAEWYQLHFCDLRNIIERKDKRWKTNDLQGMMIVRVAL